MLIFFLGACIVFSLLLLENECRRSTDSTSQQSARSAISDQLITGLETPRFTSENTQQIIIHSGFTISYCENHRLPYWVGYELTVKKNFGKHSRTDRFVPDPKLQCKQAHTSDYTHSGYDRGHMAPAADMKWSQNAMAESFYLSNICPQHPELNRRAWKQLEERVRDWAQADSLIIVVCGPILNDKCQKIGKNKISIPDGFFKVILSPFASPPQAVGFLFENTRATLPLTSYAVPIDSVEVVSGLDFFHQLPDNIEQSIETYIDYNYWGL